MARIRGLPPELTEVPAAPSSPDDPDADAKRLAFLAWRRAVTVYRTGVHRDLARDPDAIRYEREKCARDPAYWMAVWLRVFEPRRRGSGYGFLPFIPFAAQVDVLNQLRWCLEQEDENADAIWSKCRGWGASWLMCVFALWGWVFSQDWPGSPPWNVLLLSRKEELVDSKQQRSLFWKIDRLMRDLPDWQMPKGWNPDHHRQKGIILNPENGNELGGESTNTKAGRGDRATWAGLDEFQAMPNGMTIWSTIAETTDHRIGVGTEGLDEGPHHYNLGIGRNAELGIDAFPHLIESNWYQNPFNDNEWYERQRKRYAADLDAFEREINRNPWSGTSTWYYPWAWNKVARDDLKAVSGYASFVAIDPGFRDPTALVAVQEHPDDGLVVVDSYAIEGKEADYFVPLLKPDLFEKDDPHWRDKPYATWVGRQKDPDEPAPVFEYDERALAFARTVATMGSPTFVGDTYGESQQGATNDSVYSRWRRYGLVINVDRKTADAVTKTVKMGRTHLGRKEAMNDRAHRFAFAGTPGARMVLKALQNCKYKPRGDRLTQTEPKEPLHDWTSHYVTAMEFLAVKIASRRASLHRKVSKTPQPARLGGQIANMGTMRNSGVRATLRGLR